MPPVTRLQHLHQLGRSVRHGQRFQRLDCLRLLAFPMHFRHRARPMLRPSPGGSSHSRSGCLGCSTGGWRVRPTETPSSRGLAERRVVLRNPRFGKCQERLCLVDELLDFSLGRYATHVVVHHVPLASAHVQECGIGCGRRPNCELDRLKGRLVMAPSSHSKPRAGNDHLRRLEGGVVRGGKPSVVGKLLKVCVLKVALDDRPKVVQFLLARRVRPHPPRILQLLPTHARFR